MPRIFTWLLWQCEWFTKRVRELCGAEGISEKTRTRDEETALLCVICSTLDHLNVASPDKQRGSRYSDTATQTTTFTFRYFWNISAIMLTIPLWSSFVYKGKSWQQNWLLSSHLVQNLGGLQLYCCCVQAQISCGRMTNRCSLSTVWLLWPHVWACLKYHKWLSMKGTR